MSDLVAADAPLGLWIDLNYVLYASALDAIEAYRDPKTGMPIVGIFRYVRLPMNASADDISGPELSRIIARKLACALVQHVYLPGWNPELTSGAKAALVGMEHASSVFYPKDATIFVDIEGVAEKTSARPYTYQWQNTLLSANCDPGLYYGYDCGMSPDELWQAPGKHYYAAPNQPDVPNRGPCVRQRYPEGKIAMVGQVDFDDVARDLKGDVFRAAVLGQAAAA